MIRGIESRGANAATAVCDCCGEEQTERCGYSKKSGGAYQPNEAQVLNKVQAQGWTFIKNKLRCPACEAARKAEHHTQPEESPMPTTTEQDPISAPTVPALRQPTPKQKREIISMLELAYDDDRKRFKPGDSDKSIAEAIGGGVLWGWVAQVREELFGPDTRNDQAEKLSIELAAMRLDMDEKVQAIRKTIADARADLSALTESYKPAIAAMQRKLDAVLK